MRLAAVLLAVSGTATNASAQGAQATLDWTAQAGLGTEAVLLVRSTEGAPMVSVRERVTEGSTEALLALPPLTSNAASVQAGLIADGRVIAQSVKRPISGRDFDLNLKLRATLAVGFSDIWVCGNNEFVQITWTDTGLSAAQTQGSVDLVQSEVEDVYLGPAGSRVALGGNIAEITLSGQDLGTCHPMLFPPVLPLDIAAQDSDWRITLGVETAEIDLPGLPAEELATTGLRMMAPRDGSIRVTGPELDLNLHDSPCRTLTTDLLYPVTATLGQRPDGASLTGCGGDPLDLLAGVAWRVTSLFGVSFGPDMPTMTLQVTDGQIAGRTSCNRYLGRAGITADRLALSELGTTRLPCPADLSNLELRFLDALEGATGFDIWRDGGLTLRAGPFPLLTASRP